jgi:hypothetical protein
MSPESFAQFTARRDFAFAMGWLLDKEIFCIEHGKEQLLRITTLSTQRRWRKNNKNNDFSANSEGIFFKKKKKMQGKEKTVDSKGEALPDAIEK